MRDEENGEKEINKGCLFIEFLLNSGWLVPHHVVKHI
jgi:hypothetical protein